jgi:hypothetical protein
MEGRGRPGSGPLDGDGRRSIYINVRRNFLTPMFLAFDYPIPFTTIGRRSTSNVPAQALMRTPLSPRKPEKRGPSDEGLMPTSASPAVRAAFGRPATPANCITRVRGRTGPRTAERRVRSTDLCHVLLNVKIYLYQLGPSDALPPLPARPAYAARCSRAYCQRNFVSIEALRPALRACLWAVSSHAKGPLAHGAPVEPKAKAVIFLLWTVGRRRSTRSIPSRGSKEHGQPSR